MDAMQRFLNDWDALRHDWLPDAPPPYGGSARGTALEGVVQFACCSPLEHLLLRRRNWARARPAIALDTALGADDALVLSVTPADAAHFDAWPVGTAGPVASELLQVPLGAALVRHDTRRPYRDEEEWLLRTCDLAARGHGLLVDRLATDFDVRVLRRPVLVIDRATRLRLERGEAAPARRAASAPPPVAA